MNETFGLGPVGQISQRAVDLPRAVTFYRDTLGVPLLFEVPGIAFFDLDGLRMMLTKPSPGHDHPGSILYFSVSDIDSAHATLTERGVTFDRGPYMLADMGDHELWMAFFKDSEANQLALMSEVAKA